MKPKLFAAVMATAGLLFSSPVPAAPAEPATEAVVRKFDLAAGQITLTHGPIVNLGMPGMTMNFAVKATVLPKNLMPGDHLRVRIEEVGGLYTVVRAVPAP